MPQTRAVRPMSATPSRPQSRSPIAVLAALVVALGAVLIGSAPVRAAVPDAPTSVTAVAGDTSAFVRWTAPGSDVQSYTVTAHASGGGTVTRSVAGQQLGQTVVGLTNGTSYTFTVTATNADGTSAASTASAAVTPTAATPPDAQRGVVAGTVSGHALSVAFSPDGAKVYTAIGSRVSVIDVATGAVASSVAGVGMQYLAVSPDGSLLYVTQGSGMTGAVRVIDTSTLDDVATIPLGTAPFGATPVGVAFSPDGSLAYVVLSGMSVAVVEVATHEVRSAEIPLTGFGLASQVAFSPDGTRAYVTTREFGPGGSVFEIDVANSALAAGGPVAVGGDPQGVAFSPDGARAYVANRSADTGPCPDDGTVSVIDVAARTVIDTVSVAPRPVGVTVSPDGGSVYVANGCYDPYTATSSQSVSVIDATTVGTASVSVDRISAALAEPRAIAMSPDGSQLYVTSYGTGAIVVLAAESSGPTPTAPGAPTDVAGVPGDGQVVVSWTAPADDGGSPITDYVVEYSSDGGSHWSTFADGTSTATSATVTGLTNETAYTFRVSAVNAVGAGPGALSTPVTPIAPVAPATVPTVPLNVEAVSGDGQVVLSWSPPASDGGSAVTGYLVEVSHDGGSMWTTFADDVTALSVTVTGFTNGEEALVRVSAKNAVGTGPTATTSAVPEGPVAPPVYRDYNPVEPVRLVDTRAGAPAGLLPVAKAKIGPDAPLQITVTDIAGLVPDTQLVGAVALNVTAAGSASNGYITVRPCGSSNVVSSVNFSAGQDRANSVIVPVAADGTICLTSDVPTEVVVDLNGWFRAGQGHVPMVPARVFDTRPGAPAALREVPEQMLTPGQPLRVQLTDLPGASVPATGVAAVSLNVTASDPTADGYVSVTSCGPQREVSSVNFLAGQDRANAVIVPVSPDGSVCFTSTAPTHLVVDVNSWFKAGSDLQPVAPDRVFDTRPGTPPALRSVTTQPLAPGAALTVELTDLPGGLVPADSTYAVSLNVTTTGATEPGYLTVTPCGPLGEVSSVNFQAGTDTANAVLTGLSSTGRVCLHSSTAVNVVVDINGWFQHP